MDRTRITIEQFIHHTLYYKWETVVGYDAAQIYSQYHLYADAIECKMNSIVAMQDFLRREIKKMK